MASIPVAVKHQGKTYELEIDETTTGEVFKHQVYSLTGVEPDRQKIIVKGKQIKDETDLAALGLQPNAQMIMLGTPSGTHQFIRPNKSIRFVEDMSEAEAAQQEGAIPAGLVNLGNTCYLNSTLQALRSIPELHDALNGYTGSSNSLGLFSNNLSVVDLVARLRDLYKELANTTGELPPLEFLASLRAAYPQFAERARSGNGFAQQDAEEAWSHIVNQLDNWLKIKPSPESPSKSFIQRYMAGTFTTTFVIENPAARQLGEESTTRTDTFSKLDCHIDNSTNHLRDGILAALTEKLERYSDTLEMDTTYTKVSKISRLPKYLTVHFIRFYWKRDSQKKAKILRKVTFPMELDVVEFCDDKLKKMLLPVRDMTREIHKEEEDIERSRKRRKPDNGKATAKQDPSIPRSMDAAAVAADGDTIMPLEGETFKTDAEIDAERDAALLATKKRLYQVVDPELIRDEGANQTGLYQLHAVVTHRGASADSGHYTAYVRKMAPIDAITGKPRPDEDNKWWWFNDDRVSEVNSDKIATLVGGGESDSALILLYRAIPLPSTGDAEDLKIRDTEAASADAARGGEGSGSGELDEPAHHQQDKPGSS